MKKWSLKKKLSNLFLAIGIIPLAIVSILTVYSAVKTIDTLQFSKLKSIRDMQVNQLQSMFETIEHQIQNKASEDYVLTAMKNFDNSYEKYLSDTNILKNIGKEKIKGSLSHYYSNDFNKVYKSKNNNMPANHIISNVDKISDTALALQYYYISNNSNPLGEKDNLYKANDNSNWSEFHRQYHKTFKNYLAKFNYYDIFLINNNGNVVYSVFKELDFATNLVNGPYSNSNLAKTYNKAKNLKAGEVAFHDLEFYSPSYDYPAAFVGSPIYEDDKLIGTLVFQIPIEKIDDIMTVKKDWRNKSFGETGSSYLIGQDLKMRSLARGFVENQSKYFEKLTAFGIDKNALSQIKTKQTTSLLLEVSTEGTQKAIQGNIGEMNYKDYLGEEVFSSYAPVNIKGLEWYILTEMDKEEVYQPVEALIYEIIVFSIVIAISVLFIALIFSKKLSQSLLNLTDSLSRAATSSKDAASSLSEKSEKLSSSSTEQASATHETTATVTEMISMIKATDNYANNGEQIIQKVSSQTESGKEILNNLGNSMNEISHSTESLTEIAKIINEISTKTEVINDIVFKTQLLSFNASIEAARAGQHGRGFSVVAEEVGSLALMSGNAAKEISALLTESQTQVENIIKTSMTTVNSGKKISTDAIESFELISSNMSDMNSIMKDIVNATKEQELGVNEISKAISQLEITTTQNTSVANEVSDLSKSSSEQVENINRIMESLRSIIQGYGPATSAHRQQNQSKTVSLKPKQTTNSRTDKKVSGF